MPRPLWHLSGQSSTHSHRYTLGQTSMLSQSSALWHSSKLGHSSMLGQNSIPGQSSTFGQSSYSAKFPHLPASSYPIVLSSSVMPKGISRASTEINLHAGIITDRNVKDLKTNLNDILHSCKCVFSSLTPYFLDKDGRPGICHDRWDNKLDPIPLVKTSLRRWKNRKQYQLLKQSCSQMSLYQTLTFIFFLLKSQWEMNSWAV